MRGRLELVTEVEEGSSLIADVTTGGLLLPVENADDFAEPCLVEVAGESYLVVDVTDAEELVLDPSTPLLASLAAVDEWTVYALSNTGRDVRRYAHLAFDDDGDTIPCLIPTGLHGYFRLGETDAGALVEVEPVGMTYQVSSRPFDDDQFDGGFIDITTLPEGGPVVLPSVSPTPTTKAGPAAAIVEWAPTVGLRYEVHVSDVNTGTPDGTTLAVDAAGPPMWIYTMADGVTKLPTTQDAYVALVAYNSANEKAPASPWVAMRAGNIPPENITVLAGEVLAQSMNTDDFRAETISGASLDVAGILLNPSKGLYVPSTTADVPRFQVPINPSEAIQILAYARLLGAVFDGNVTWRGLVNFLHGKLTLGNGITDPTTPPGVSWDWDSLTTDAFTASATFGNGLWHGLTSDGGTNWVTAEDYVGVGKLIRYSSSTGALTGSTTLEAGFQPSGGVVRIGTNFYVLGHHADDSDNWWVYRYNSSYVLTGKRKVFTATGITGTPCIGGDSNAADRLLIGLMHKGTTTLRVRDYLLTEFASLSDTSTAPIAVEQTLLTGTVYNLGGVRRANFDGLTNGLMVATISSTMFVFNSAGTRQTALERPRADGAFVYGLSWDGTRWRTFSGNGKVWIYSLHDGASRAYGYTWYDGDSADGSTLAESKLSPTVTRTVPRGARPRISTDPPSDDGTANAPDRVRVYADDHLQATYAVGELGRSFDSLNMGGAASPTVSGFASRPATAPGAIEPAAGGWGFYGDGTVTLPAVESGKIVRTADLTITTSTTTVTFQTAAENTPSGFADVANNRLVIPKAGLYMVEAQVVWTADSSATGIRQLGVMVNGTVKRISRLPSSGASVNYNTLTATIRLAAGDLLTMNAFQSSGSNKSAGSSGDTDTYLAATRIGA